MTFFLLLVCFGFLILFPSTSFEGAKNGLLLWFQIVLPTLFPFLVITNLMESLLPIASGRVYALFTGFLSG
ncbi:MAG: transporter, partial [Acetivibrio sp.]